MKPIIVTFLNEPYIDVGANWLRFAARLDLDADIRIVALDSATRTAFPAPHVIYRPVDASELPKLWIHRTNVLRELLDQGREVIHTDADAIWLKNPLPIMRDCDADLVFSQGTVWPPDVHKKRGIVACCGVFYMRPVETVGNFLRQATIRMMGELEQNPSFDDQVTVNRMIDEELDHWEVHDPYEIGCRGKTFQASPEIIQGTCRSGLRVAILPHHAFPRIVREIIAETVIAHPLSEKTDASKVDALSHLGLWQAN